MLPRSLRIFCPPLWRAGERHTSTANRAGCQYMQYFWKSTGIRWPSKRMTATYSLRNRPQRIRVTSHSWQHLQYHHPFSLGSMSTSCLFSAPMSTQTTSLPLWAFHNTTVKECHVRLYSTNPPPSSQDSEGLGTPGEKRKTEAETVATQDKEEKEKKLSLVQRFKQMYKQYWYVLIPVHVVTSAVWYGSFFIAAKSGMDIVAVMGKLGAGEKILTALQNSNAGYYAIAYAMYKIATPARYTVTVAGTTISINYLKKRGYIKPVPSAEQLKEMYEVVAMKCRCLLKAIFKKKHEATLPSHLYRQV